MALDPKHQPIAMIVAAGFVEEQFTATQKRLLAAEMDFQVLSPDGGLVQGWHDGAWGHHFMADDKLADVLSADFRAVIVPGGERAVAALEANPHGARLIKAFIDAGKPVCVAGPVVKLLATAEVAAGRRIAADGEAAEALTTAGATIGEDAIVTDGTLITARDDADFGAVLTALIAQIHAAEDAVEEAA